MTKKEYYKKNREILLAKLKKYRLENPDKVRESTKKSYYRHRRKRLAKAKLYREQNKEKYLAWCKQNYLKHREERIEYARKYRIKHREKCRAAGRQSYHRYANVAERQEARRKLGKERYQKNKAAILKRMKLEYPKRRIRLLKRSAERRQLVLNHYGRECKCCGLADTRFLTLDHMNNGRGNPRKKGEPTGDPLYRKLIKAGYPKGFQTLCMNCNWMKGLYGKCPHQTDREGVGLG